MNDRSILSFNLFHITNECPLGVFLASVHKITNLYIRAHWALPKSIPVIVPASVDESCDPARLPAHGSSQDSGETISPLAPSFSESPFDSSSLSSFTPLIDLLLNIRRFFKSSCVGSCFCQAVPSSWKPWRREPWAPGGVGGGHHAEGGGHQGPALARTSGALLMAQRLSWRSQSHVFLGQARISTKYHLKLPNVKTTTTAKTQMKENNSSWQSRSHVIHGQAKISTIQTCCQELRNVKTNKTERIERKKTTP